jgi:hypothetical protein
MYAPASSTASSFDIAVIQDFGTGAGPLLEPDPGNPGRPGALYAFTASATDVNKRLDVEIRCPDTAVQCGLYDCSITLPAPFTVAAGVRYWLLIQAEFTTRNSSSSNWRQGRRDDGYSRSHLANTSRPWDYAFSLRGILSPAAR